MMSRWRGAVAVGLVVGNGGCGHGAVVQAEPQYPRCRDLIVRPAESVASSLRWFGPGQDDEVVRHFQWCRAVGPSVVSIAERRDSTPIDSLAIVSFNVNLGAGAAFALIDSLRRGRYTDGVPVVDYLVLLQEAIREGSDVPDRVPEGSGAGRGRYPAPATGSRIDVVALADSLGLHLFYTPAMRSGKGRNPRGLSEDRGNAILGTIPLERLTVIELPFGGARRIGQVATVAGRTRRGTPWRLDVANVHFDVGPIGPSAFSAIRARQARAMVAVLDSSRAAVVAGDLNAFSLTGTAESVQILRRAFPDSINLDPPATRGGQRLDFIFYRLPAGASTTGYRALASDFGSDHRPIIGWVRFGGI